MSISSAWERSWRNAQQSAWLVRLSLFVIVFALTAIAWAVPAFSLDPPQVSFRDQIRPILQQHCWACHGGVKKAGDLKLTSESDARGVLESSADEVPELLRRIVTNDVDERMPPPDHGRALHAVEIELIKKWFDEGAVWQGHWAFDPPKRTSLHKDPSSWSRDPLDTWVMSSMPRSQGSFNSDRLIEPSSAESPERWIRRATLSLIGIPPTAEEIDTFVHDENQYGELAYEHAVDQLLASPKFGEHWASVWLDQVRYADSRGLGQDGPRPMWNYRDWVVRSFNQDLPYDEFTRMQLAGDLKPKPEIDDLVATAVHRLTQTNEEGGTDDEEFRVMAVIDRINTTWQVWQGLTFGCAQCHDHPYDPIRQVDFYSFMDFLNNTSDWDLNEEYPLLAVPVDNTFNERAGELDRSIRDVRWQIWNDELPWLVDKNHWISPKSLQVSATKGTEVAINEEQKNEFHTVGTVQRDTSFTMLVPIDRPTKLTAVRLTLRALDPLKAAIDTEVGSIISHIEIQTRPNRDAQWETAKISRVIGDEPEPFINPNESLNPKSNIGFGAYARIQHDRQAAFVLESPISLALGSEIQIRTDHKMFILDSFVLVPRRMSVAINSIEQGISIPRDELLSKLRASLAEMVRERAAIKSVTLPIVRDLPPNLHRSTHLFIRGLFLTKDQQVHANLPVWATEHSISPDDRVGLAEWMVHENNTLTSRVHVNRLWSRVFGSGLVVSEEDFGSSGELPSHPELLDELAVRFQRDYRWSQKKLLRDLILSSTFRQSNRASSE